MSCIAIIPARGGSKRLPRKNILPINGHPMVAYPVRAALASKLFSDVVVSTEDEEIARVAEQYGATVAHRLDRLATDRSTVADVCHNLLQQSQYNGVDTFCCIYATAAFVTPSQLTESHRLLDTANANYVMGVSHFNYPPVKALVYQNGYLESLYPAYQQKKSQEFPECVVSNGTLYWGRTQAFLDERDFYGHKLVGYPVEAVDIDNQADYESACSLAQQKGLQLF